MLFGYRNSSYVQIPVARTVFYFQHYGCLVKLKEHYIKLQLYYVYSLSFYPVIGFSLQKNLLQTRTIVQLVLLPFLNDNQIGMIWLDWNAKR